MVHYAFMSEKLFYRSPGNDFFLWSYQQEEMTKILNELK
jgi:hypothetical protein